MGNSPACPEKVQLVQQCVPVLSLCPVVLMKLSNDQENITFGAREMTQWVKAVAVQVWCVQAPRFHSKSWMCCIAIGRSEMEEEERRLSKAYGTASLGYGAENKTKQIRNPVSNQGGK